MLQLIGMLWIVMAALAQETPKAVESEAPQLPPELATTAELSGWVKTGRAKESLKLCREFQARYSDKVRCQTYGTTPEGRTLHYLVVEDLSFSALKPTLWLQAGIHAGEIDGKDATYWYLRDLLADPKASQVLKKLRIIFVPIVNLDGHERFGAHNRPNQRGPEEMGWRVTAENLNLNRDFAKAEAPEMRALLKLWHEHKPLLSVDLHVTNGADFQYEVGLVTTPSKFYGSSALHRAGSELEEQLVSALVQKGQKALPFYPSFLDELDPTKGFARYVPQARFAHGYWRLNNRLGLLVEAHSWKDYPTRVKTQRAVVETVVQLLDKNAARWLGAVREEERAKRNSIELAFTHTEKSSPLDFLGYAYQVIDSQISGGKVIRYDTSKPQVLRLPVHHELRPTISVKAPRRGYYVAKAEVPWVKAKLKVHGLKYHTVKKELRQSCEVFVTSSKKFAPESFEGRHRLTVEGQWEERDCVIEKGALFVPTDENPQQLVAHLFEPLSSDSFLAWGHFNRWFERKEYMEDYVAEDVARELLKDPQVKKAFEARLAADEAFRKDPQQRFEFFYRRHASWDQKYESYPVVRQ